MNSQEPIWDKLYHRKLTWKKETMNLPNLIKNKSVLELGVGNGKTLTSILKQNPSAVTAIDISQEALNKCSQLLKSHNVTLLKADITQLPFNEEFDVIVCYYTLNNLLEKERKEAITQIAKSLKKGGVILFEDFAVGDFREKESSKQIESNTLERDDGLICHFFVKKEIESLFKSFKILNLSEKILHPIRKNQKLERRIISATMKR